MRRTLLALVVFVVALTPLIPRAAHAQARPCSVNPKETPDIAVVRPLQEIRAGSRGRATIVERVKGHELDENFDIDLVPSNIPSLQVLRPDVDYIVFAKSHDNPLRLGVCDITQVRAEMLADVKGKVHEEKPVWPVFLLVAGLVAFVVSLAFPLRDPYPGHPS